MVQLLWLSTGVVQLYIVEYWCGTAVVVVEYWCGTAAVLTEG